MHRRDEPRLLLYALVLMLAVLVHLPALIAATVFMRPTEEKLPEVRELEAIQLVEEPDPADDPEQENTFVSLDKPEKETPPPEEARFLDRYNQKVEEESVRRREPGDSGSPAPPAPQRPPRPAQPQQPPPKGKPEAEAEPNALPELEPEAEAPLLEDDPEAPAARSDDGATALEVKPRQDTAPDRAEPGKGKIDLDPSIILPSLENVGSSAKGSGGSPDYLRDVAEGDKDLLNRKESRYWVFFDRVRAAVGRQWNPNAVYRANDPRGQIYGVEDRLTILHVTLKGDGSLHNLYVEKPCGLAFLDNEAVRAMRVAQPFTNPPEGLKDDQGLISFTFGFMFEIQSRGGRIIRYSR